MSTKTKAIGSSIGKLCCGWEDLSRLFNQGEALRSNDRRVDRLMHSAQRLIRIELDGKMGKTEYDARKIKKPNKPL